MISNAVGYLVVIFWVFVLGIFIGYTMERKISKKTELNSKQINKTNRGKDW